MNFRWHCISQAINVSRWQESTQMLILRISAEISQKLVDKSAAIIYVHLLESGAINWMLKNKTDWIYRIFKIYRPIISTSQTDVIN